MDHNRHVHEDNQHPLSSVSSLLRTPLPAPRNLVGFRFVMGRYRSTYASGRSTGSTRSFLGQYISSGSIPPSKVVLALCILDQGVSLIHVVQ